MVFFAIICLVLSIRFIESPFPNPLPPLPRPDMSFIKEELNPRFHRASMAERSKASYPFQRSLWRLQVRFPYGDTLDGATSIFFIIGDKNSLSI